MQKLTGGILLSRNKDFLVFYRGKNFLSREVAEALLEKERLAKTLQDDEEQARLRATAIVIPKVEINDEFRTAGSLEETLDASARWGKTMDNRDKVKVMREAEMLKHANLVRKLESKLAFVSPFKLESVYTIAMNLACLLGFFLQFLGCVKIMHFRREKETIFSFFTNQNISVSSCRQSIEIYLIRN